MYASISAPLHTEPTPPHVACCAQCRAKLAARLQPDTVTTTRVQEPPKVRGDTWAHGPAHFASTCMSSSGFILKWLSLNGTAASLSLRHGYLQLVLSERRQYKNGLSSLSPPARFFCLVDLLGYRDDLQRCNLRLHMAPTT